MIAHVERRPQQDGTSAYRVRWAGNGLHLSEDEARELYAQLGLALAETRNESAQVDATHQTSVEAALEASEW